MAQEYWWNTHEEVDGHAKVPSSLHRVEHEHLFEQGHRGVLGNKLYHLLDVLLNLPITLSMEGRCDDMLDTVLRAKGKEGSRLEAGRIILHET